MSGKSLMLGIDLGTSSVKALLLREDAQVERVASAPYTLHRSIDGTAEQDTNDWWHALRLCLGHLRAAGASLNHISAIGLSGQMHGLITLDRAGQPLGTCHTWADTRSSAALAELAARVDTVRLSSITGSGPYTSATVSKMLWMRANDPERWRRTAYVLLPKDEMRRRLTGVLATDPSDASGTQLLDIGTRRWSDELLAALDLSPGLLPPILESAAIAGTLSRDAAHALELSDGIPVVTGGGDAECAALGVGIDGGPEHARTALISLGTAAQCFLAVNAPRIDPSGWLQTFCHVVPDHWHVMYPLLMGASALDWLSGLTSPPSKVRVPAEALLDDARMSPPGACGLIFLPYVDGMRVPVEVPTPQSAFVGLNARHSRADLARAVVEGIAISLDGGIRAAQANGLATERIRLAGGGARHAIWAQTLADVTGLPVERCIAHDASARGAALLAAQGVGARETVLRALEDSALVNEVSAPVTELSPLYQRKAAITHDLLSTLRPAFRQIEANLS